MHIPHPDPDQDEEQPERKIPNPPVPPDAEPVVPQRDPPKPDEPGGPPPMIARPLPVPLIGFRYSYSEAKALRDNTLAHASI